MLARWHGAAGNRDRALDALGELVARNPAGLQPLKNDPLLDSVRARRALEARLESKIMTHRPLAIASLVFALAGAAQPAFAQAAPAPQPTFRWDDHPSIRLGSGTHIDLRARFSGDVRRLRCAAAR